MKPLFCYYYLTYKCNLKCCFCSIWRDDNLKNTDSSSVDIVKNNLFAAKKLGSRILDLTGGEPLLYEDIGEVLSYAKKIGFFTSLTTNGILFKERVAELTGKIDIFQFSIITGNSSDINPNIDLLSENIYIAKIANIRPSLIFTVTDENINLIPVFKNLAEKNNILLFLNPCFSYSDNTGLSKESLKEIIKLSSGRNVSADIGYIKFAIDGGNNIKKPVCTAGDSTMVISPDNKLILPCFHNKTHEFPINDNLYELFFSEEVKKITSMSGKLQFCEGCTVYCYMRASLYRLFNRYGFKSLLSAAEYLYKLYRT